MTDFETNYRDLVAAVRALADEWANQDPAYWHMLHEPDVKRAIEAAQYALAEDFHALLASSPAEGEDDPDPEGCDCTELCEMGPTCPGGSLARLPGSGCWRTTSGTNRTQIPVAVDGLSQGAGGTCPSECAETNHPGREHGQWIAAPSPAEGEGEGRVTFDRHGDGFRCYGWTGSRWHNPKYWAPHIHCDEPGCKAECQPCSVGDGFHRSSPHSPAEHEACDCPAPVSSGEAGKRWIDRHGDVWTFDEDGIGTSPECANFSRKYVEKKWGPLSPAAMVTPSTEGGDQ